MKHFFRDRAKLPCRLVCRFKRESERLNEFLSAGACSRRSGWARVEHERNRNRIVSGVTIALEAAIDAQDPSEETKLCKLTL